jgi:hypothetical protein
VPQPLTLWSRLSEQENTTAPRGLFFLENGDPVNNNEDFAYVFAVAARSPSLLKYTLVGASVAVNTRHLITARHVAREAFQGVVQGPTPQFNPNDNTHTYQIHKVFNHPSADLAVLRIQSSLSADVNFPTLAPPNSFPHSLSSKGTMVGFGPRGNNVPPAFIGKKLRSDLVPASPTPGLNSSDLFAVQLNTFATCRNDSGGPFVVGNDTIAGIAVTSTAAMACDPTTPDTSYFLRIDPYYDWIQEQLAQP